MHYYRCSRDYYILSSPFKVLRSKHRGARPRALTEQIVANLRVVPRRAQDLGYEFRFSELEPALRDLLESQ